MPSSSTENVASEPNGFDFFEKDSPRTGAHRAVLAPNGARRPAPGLP
jgi:hypothetical protein